MWHISRGCLVLSVLCWGKWETLDNPWMNRVCARLPVFSSFISYGDHQHWRMPWHGNLGQCSLSLCPRALHCGSPKMYSVEGSPRISCAAHRRVTLKYIQHKVQGTLFFVSHTIDRLLLFADDSQFWKFWANHYIELWTMYIFTWTQWNFLTVRRVVVIMANHLILVNSFMQANVKCTWVNSDSSSRQSYRQQKEPKIEHYSNSHDILNQAMSVLKQ